MSAIPVLIVEDNLANLKLVSVLLEAYGFEIRTASDAQEALTVLSDFEPRVILMDLQLPGMDGYALVRLLKSDPGRSDIPIVAVTAYAMAGDEEKAREAGCDAYVSKPIDTRTLPVLIGRLAEQLSH